ncbi:MAG: CoA-binding protein [Balneolaceae bacterium]|nr:CoA-binding protein [Balneolaceae bacterium]
MANQISSLKEILTETKTIAIIGCSPNRYRTSNYAANFLQEKGYRIIPINPKTDQIMGKPCYDRLIDVPDSEEIDVVNIFRNKKYTADALKDVVRWKEKTGQSPVVWTQLDVSSKEAEEIAEQHELPYIRNRCIMVEWDRNIK